jgi:membrane-bound lytic murein transglycosylase F
MKKISLLILFLISFFLLSCGERDESNNTKPTKRISDLDQIKNRGKLVALTGYNSYSYFVYRGQPMGFEYDLVSQLAESLDLDLEIVIVKEINKMFEMLNNGEGDIIAFNLTVTKERAKQVSFTKHHNTTVQTLVQRKPDNWRDMKLHEIEETLIRNPIELEGKTIHVESGSAYLSRLENLSEEIGGDINIVVAEPELSTEELIEMVAAGVIDYTVADENIARLHQAYYSNIDTGTKVSLPQRIAWAVRKDSDELLNTVNFWLEEMQKKPAYFVTYRKYYKNRNEFKSRIKSDFFLSRSGRISEYDDLVKENLVDLPWDWRLIASQIYQESQFDPTARSWAGAVGLMQLLPETAENFGAKDPFDPKQSVDAGIEYMAWLDNYFIQYVDDPDERIKFVLASYNIGFGHVEDAIRLAKKYGADPQKWKGNVAEYLLKKSKKKYYNDEVVRNGYCRGVETVDYVEEIFERFEHYKQFISASNEQLQRKLFSFVLPFGKR